MLIIFDELVLLGMAIIFQYLMLKPRFTRNKTIFTLIIGSGIVFSLNLPLFHFWSAEQLNPIYPLRVIIPIFFLFTFLSKTRGVKLLFNLLTTVLLCILTTLSGYLVAFPFQFNEAAKIAGRFIAFIPLYFFVARFFKHLYFEMLEKLKKGWVLLCLIPLLISALYYYCAMFEGDLKEHPENSFPIIISALLFMVTYAVICVFFQQIEQLFALQSERQLMQAQVSALKNQSVAVMESMKTMSIYRHDMRHYMQSIRALLENGNTKAALDYMGSLSHSFEKAEISRYCENETLNAILFHYIDMAEKEGIKVSTKLDIPQQLPVKEMELATVLANAIENARNACRLMPKGKERAIQITCVTKPRFAFEISNTYYGEVLFNESGLPMATEEGHGLGSQSIAAFVKKYNAILDYQTDNGLFRIRILLT